ncbi:MAG: sulfite exporter TauE/SafE family protein [Candidatus Omnitrophota bacterium]
MQFIYVCLGLIAGIFSGFLGIGGGTVLIPAMIYLFGLTQHQAQGTTLALMIPPIGLLAAMKYYHEGNVKISMAIFICLGFFLGGLIGAEFAHKVSAAAMRKIFGIVILIVSLKMIFSR